jgi:hypothetical protein
MLTLTSVHDKLILTKKRYGLVVEKSIVPEINVRDEVVEINNIRVELLSDSAVKRNLSEPIVSMLILPSDQEQLIKFCLKANNIFVEKSRKTNIARIQNSSDNLLQVIHNLYY